MKRLITLLFAAAFVTAASAQSGRNDSRYNNGYQSSPYSNNDQYAYSDQYRNDGDDRNVRGYGNPYERRRQQIARQRYEMMMMRRQQERYYNQRRYNSYPYGVSRRPSLQISIGIGGRRY